MTTKVIQKPAPGYLIVKLSDYYEGIKIPETKYESKTEGTVLRISNIPRTEDHVRLTAWAVKTLKAGTKVHWREYAEGKRQTFEGQQTAAIRIEDIEYYE